MDEITSPGVPSATTSSAGQPSRQEHLEGHLGTGGLVFSALAFNAPLGVMAATVPIVIGLGVGAGTPLVYLAIMVLILVFAVALVTMARHMQKPGAFYTYVTAGLGRTVGLGGGFLAMVTYLGLGSSTYVISGFTTESMIQVLGGPRIPWWEIVLVQWVVITFLGSRNVDVSMRVLGVALGVEVLIVAIWTVAVLANGGPQGRSLHVTAQMSTGSLGFALLWGMSCLGGFESIQLFRDETRNPVKTIPRATYLTVFFLAGFYCLGSYVYLVAFGTHEAMATAADPTNSFMASVGTYTGTFLKNLAYVLTWSSGVASLLAIHNITARYAFAFGRDGVFPRALAQVHPRYKSPFTAALVIAVVTLLFAVGPALLQMDAVASYTVEYGFANIALAALFAGTALATVVFFSRGRNRHLRISVWKRVVAPVAAFAGMLFVLYLAAVQRDTLFGSSGRGTAGIGILVLLALAGMLYARWLKVNRPEVYERIGDQDEKGEVPPLVEAETRAESGGCP
ncbi:APC family permease [Streptomyces sp. NPDC005811]|uniref:APC family permease n=1 Tax=Streptomyces sp. NPDC005811 TaxID=3154565 RepID=UPI003401BD8D